MSPKNTLNRYVARTQRWIIAGLCARCINCMVSTRCLNIRTPPPSTEQPKTYLRLSCHVHRVLFGNGPQTEKHGTFLYINIKLSTVLLYKMTHGTKHC